MFLARRRELDYASMQGIGNQTRKAICIEWKIRRSKDEPSAWAKDAGQLVKCVRRVGQMFDDPKAGADVEALILKWKPLACVGELTIQLRIPLDGIVDVDAGHYSSVAPEVRLV